jgi:uncharacterized membrane protein SirB2
MQDNRMNKSNARTKEIAHHIFNGSLAMIGVCITVITLFKVFNAGILTFADEILGIDTFVYIISAILSYMSLRSETNKKLEWFADILFFFGMFVMVFVGVIIVFFAW